MANCVNEGLPVLAGGGVRAAPVFFGRDHPRIIACVMTPRPCSARGAGMFATQDQFVGCHNSAPIDFDPLSVP